MKTLRRKLHSKTGSSLIMTMVYFLFCIFVGGSVLAAATANGGRLLSQKASRQDYYTQRSAALLLKEQMQNNPGVQATLEEKTTSKLEMNLGMLVPVPISTERKIIFTKVPSATPQNDLQKLISDAAINLFWEKNEESDNQDYFAGTILQDSNPVNRSTLKKPEGFLKLTITVDGEDTEIPVHYICSYVGDETDTGQDLNFTFEVLDKEQQSLFTVLVTGSITKTVREPATNGLPGGKQEKVKSTDYNIRWNDAIIQKGGAS